MIVIIIIIAIIIHECSDEVDKSTDANSDREHVEDKEQEDLAFAVQDQELYRVEDCRQKHYAVRYYVQDSKYCENQLFVF